MVGCTGTEGNVSEVERVLTLWFGVIWIRFESEEDQVGGGQMIWDLDASNYRDDEPLRLQAQLYRDTAVRLANRIHRREIGFEILQEIEVQRLEMGLFDCLEEQLLYDCTGRKHRMVREYLAVNMSGRDITWMFGFEVTRNDGCKMLGTAWETLFMVIRDSQVFQEMFLTEILNRVQKLDREDMCEQILGVLRNER